MSTYVLSDVHGHLRALDDALAQASPGADDTLYVLGDLVDRGPDPRGVIRLVRSLPNAHCLRGNHEDLLLDCADAPEDQGAWLQWTFNGGAVTAEQLMDMPPETYESTIDWIRHLPLYELVTVNGRIYVLCHAGILPVDEPAPAGGWTEQALESVLQALPDHVFTWVREEFWAHPTGLVNSEGEGPVVIAGHTPVIYLPRFAPDFTEDPLNDEGLARMVAMGACEATGGVPDKWDIDCAAAAGWPVGRVGILRLDDGAQFYGRIEEGE